MKMHKIGGEILEILDRLDIVSKEEQAKKIVEALSNAIHGERQ